MTDTTTTDDAKHDGAHRGRRISWAEFYKLRPDLRPANQNDAAASDVIQQRQAG